MGEKEPGQESTQDAKRAGNEERILTSSNLVGGIVLSKRKDVSAHKGTDLSNGRSIRVVLSPNGGSASLGRDQANVVTRTKFAQSQEDTMMVSGSLNSEAVRCSYP